MKIWRLPVFRGEEHHQFGKHHKNYVDVMGQRFGKLVVVSQEPGKGVECKCDCGRTHFEDATTRLTHGRRTSCGVCTGKGNPKFSREEDSMIRKWAGVKSTAEIAELVTELGRRKCYAHTIKNRARKLGVSLRRTGEAFPHSKASDEDVELCRALYEAGMRPKLIAEKMEMSRSQVNNYVYFYSRLENSKVA